MSDHETLPPIEEWMPFDQDAATGDEPEHLGPFSYIGRGLTPDEFRQYLATYDFGSVPPDFIVLHHTAVPTLAQWTGGESGDDASIRTKRKRALDNLMAYYRDSLGWGVGPHLFIDDRYIWLFSPMNEPGIHAMWGNSHSNGGSFHYSIGIEVVGDYTNQPWSPAVARVVGQAVAALKQRLNTFEIRYIYPNGNPGIGAGGNRPLHPERLAWGGLSSHRDYNKPGCPGNAITENYYVSVIQSAWDEMSQPVGPVLTVDSPLIGPASGTQSQAVSFIRASLPADSEYQKSVEEIVGYYWKYAPQVGLDPFLAVTQCVLETGGLTSQWAARPHRNPAGLGVRQEGGLNFETWDAAVQAHIGQLLAFALSDTEANDAQRQMMGRNPRHGQIGADLRGTAKTVGALNNRWTSDADYGSKIVSRAAAMQGRT